MSPIGKIRISVFLLGILICLFVASVNGQQAGGNGNEDEQPPAGGDGGGNQQPPAGGDGGGNQQPPAGGDGGGNQQPPAGGNSGEDDGSNSDEGENSSEEEGGRKSRGQRGRGNYKNKKSGKYSAIFEKSSDVPSFCQEKACPKFTAEYELRNYGKTSWLTVGKSGFVDSLKDLKNYLNGKNAEKRKIKIGVPVLKEYVGDNTQPERMLFYTSETNLPDPDDDFVKIFTIPSGLRYVKVFGGFATNTVVVANKKQLVGKISGGYDTGSYYAAIFNSPFQKEDRHNELWVLATQAP